MKNKYIQYYVEGETEVKLINVLKTELKVIRAEKVQKMNVVDNMFTDARLMTLRAGTMVVLVFDTDTGNVDTLNKNLEKLRKCSAISEFVTIPQNPNLEGELVYSCAIKSIRELLDSKSNEKFKSDIIRTTNLTSKLMRHDFDIKKFWSHDPPSLYKGIKNMADKIRLIG